MFSSICPLQLSSNPLHVSAVGCVPLHMTPDAPLHTVKPALHTPMALLHAWLTKSSSIAPLLLLSTPSHGSDDGLHAPNTPLVHNAPQPTGHGGSSGCPMNVSMIPLQSLSVLSQTSGVGPTAPTHVPTPFWQERVPWLHAPSALPHEVPSSPSSTAPLQLLSNPSQISAVGNVAVQELNEPKLHTWYPTVHLPTMLNVPFGYCGPHI
jgi:hypothetical protein